VRWRARVTGFGGRHDHGAIPQAADRHPQLAREAPGVHRGDQAEIDRLGREVDERALPHVGEHAVDIQAAHETRRDEDATEARARALLDAKCPAQLLFVDQTTLDE